MAECDLLQDGLDSPVVSIRACQLLGTVCILGGAECPLIGKEEASRVLEIVKADPTAAVRLESPAECIPHYARLHACGYRATDPAEAFNRKRDLDVLQKLGLVPGSVRRARYLYELLFAQIATPDGICAYGTPGWEGCELARSGAYESVRAQGWSAVVYARTAEEIARYREDSARRIATGECLFVRPHHLMCMACWYAGGKGTEPRPNDTIWEILQRIRKDPDVPIVLVEGTCSACDCCDGFHPQTGRCVHAGGLIRDYKKDLDVLQKLGLMPGDSMPARALLDLIFERIPSTTDICGYGDDQVTSIEWRICGGPGGNAGYEQTRRTGVL